MNLVSLVMADPVLTFSSLPFPSTGLPRVIFLLRLGRERQDGGLSRKWQEARARLTSLLDAWAPPAWLFLLFFLKPSTAGCVHTNYWAHRNVGSAVLEEQRSKDRARNWLPPCRVCKGLCSPGEKNWLLNPRLSQRTTDGTLRRERTCWQCGFLLTLGPSALKLKKKKKKNLKKFYFIVFGSNNEKNVTFSLNTLHLTGYVLFQWDLRNLSVSYEIGSLHHLHYF